MANLKVGVIGGGQLAWMMAQEALGLGLELHVQTPNPEDPAVALAAATVFSTVDCPVATTQLAQDCGVITFENEFVDLLALEKLAGQGTCFRPSLQALAPLLDKLHQRQFLKALGLPVPPFSAYSPTLSPEYPFVLKARRQGYDGQGTHIIQNLSEWQELEPSLSSGEWLLEDFVPFTRELALIAARGVTGEIVFYPLVATHQIQQVCRWVWAPDPQAELWQTQVEEYAKTILTTLDYVGVLGIELFLTPEGKIYINELAPRTHNSGHYTLDACHTSQFALHLQAVSGLPLGSTAMICPQALMINLLGYETASKEYHQQRQELGALPQAHLHWYQKKLSRPGRKLGHLTLLGFESWDLVKVQSLVARVEGIWYGQNKNIFPA